MDAQRAYNVSLRDVTNYLIDNCIPPEWVDHAYRFIEVHYSGSVIQQDLLDSVDNERLARLHAYRIPAPIAAWDGWRHPSEAEVAHLHQIMDSEKTRAAAQTTRAAHKTTHRRGMDAPSWLLAGQDGIVEFLPPHPCKATEMYMSTHTVN